MVNPDGAQARAHAVLVIDDDEGTRDLLAFALGSRGLRVELAADGRSAARLLRRGRFTAVVCDIVLPGRSGLELLPALARLARGAPIILISATPPDAVLQAVAAETGAAAFISKPLDLDDLYWLIARAAFIPTLRPWRLNPDQGPQPA